jgi:hypothetical protein
MKTYKAITPNYDSNEADYVSHWNEDEQLVAEILAAQEPDDEDAPLFI